jgi:hypothetical protein
MVRLTVFGQSIAAGPFLDECKLSRIIQINKKIVANATFFKPCWSDEALKNLPQLGFAPRLGVDMSDYIYFHGTPQLDRHHSAATGRLGHIANRLIAGKRRMPSTNSPS